MLGSLSVPEHPTGATFFDRYVDQAIAGEATPCLELGADAWIAADHGDEVAITAAAERSYQIRQEARGKCLGAGVEFNARVRSHAVYYSFCLRKSKTVWVLQARGEPAADRLPSSVLGQTAAAASFSFAPPATIFPWLRSLEIFTWTASHTTQCRSRPLSGSRVP